MTNTRTIHLSLDHLSAEMLAFPFASRQSLEVPTSRLSLQLERKTGEFWRKVERYFVQRFPNLSLDELVSLRNLSWFDSTNRLEEDSESLLSLRLDQLLRTAASRCLRALGGVAEPTLSQSDSMSDKADLAARRAWRWLTFSMPGDLLLAGLSRDGSGPTRVNVICPAVDALLRTDGYAETHLHLGAGFDFSTAWASVVNGVARESSSGKLSMQCEAFGSPGADHQEGRDLAQWLVRACIVRYLLGWYLGSSHTRSGRLEAFLGGDGPAGRLDEHGWTRCRQPIRQAIADLCHGRLRHLPQCPPPRVELQSFARFQRAYNALTTASTISSPRRLDEIQRLDPLSDFFEVHPHAGPSVQLQFLWRGLDYLTKNPQDILFADLFWQVERVRGQVYRHCVQRPLTPGLMNFIRFYDRKSPVVRVVDNVALESCGVLGGVGHGLRSLEVRTSPAADADEQTKNLAQMCKGIANLRRPPAERERGVRERRLGRVERAGWEQLEIGLVLHFLKSRGKQADEGAPAAFDWGNHADPAIRHHPWSKVSSNQGYRWDAYWRNQQCSANAIAKAIERKPELLYLFRGLDVCRDEQGVPCWVVAPLFQAVRERIDEARKKFRLKHGEELPALRATAHVGEDFVHLASGLRYMDEAIEHLGLRQGDRVGHGLALGTRADTWASEATRLPMPLEDRWFDLIWERRQHAVHGARFSNDRRLFVEDEIVRIARVLFRSSPGEAEEFDWKVADAMLFASWLYDAGRLFDSGFPSRWLPGKQPTGLERQFERYLTEPVVYRRCRSVEWVSVRRDAEAVVELQRLVRQRYADRGIAIEVNPISNLLVGNLTDLQSHPLWRLAPGLGNDDGATLRITIGSDDPFPFATTLPEEYQFLYDSLILAGKSHAESREWLHLIQRLGMESRFTLPTAPDP